MSLAPEWVAGNVKAKASLWTIWHQTAEVLKVKIVQIHPGSVFLKRPAPGVTSRLLFRKSWVRPGIGIFFVCFCCCFFFFFWSLLLFFMALPFLTGTSVDAEASGPRAALKEILDGLAHTSPESLGQKF